MVHGDMAALPQQDIPVSVFAEQMVDAVDGTDFSDVCFVLSDGFSVYAHKAMLVSRSDFFKTIFEGMRLLLMKTLLTAGAHSLP